VLKFKVDIGRAAHAEITAAAGRPMRLKQVAALSSLGQHRLF